MSITNFAKLFMKSNLNSTPFKSIKFLRRQQRLEKKWDILSHYLNFTIKASKVFSWITSGVHKKYWNTNFWRFWLCCVVKTVRTHLWVGSFFYTVNDLWVRPLLSVDKLSKYSLFLLFLQVSKSQYFFSILIIIVLIY